MIIPADGDTFAYQMTFTNNTSDPQVFDAWTKVILPLGNSIDPLYGPELIALDPFETVVIDHTLAALDTVSAPTHVTASQTLAQQLGVQRVSLPVALT